MGSRAGVEIAVVNRCTEFGVTVVVGVMLTCAPAVAAVDGFTDAFVLGVDTNALLSNESTAWGARKFVVPIGWDVGSRRFGGYEESYNGWRPPGGGVAEGHFRQG